MLRRMGFGLAFLTLIISGCSVSNKSGKSTKVHSQVLKPAEVIKILKIEPIIVRAGDQNGVFLSHFLDAIDSRNGERITEFGIGSPRWGSLKVYPNGHFRYYPPERACRDEVKVTLTARGGIAKDVLLPIQVLPQEEPRTEENQTQSDDGRENQIGGAR